MFHILSSCTHKQDPWSYNFMRGMSWVFWLHQNFSTHRCRRSAIHALQHFITSSYIILISSRKRLTTLNYQNFIHNVSHLVIIDHKHDHDLTTLCASCHECFDYIKTFATHRFRRSAIHADHTSSLRLASHHVVTQASCNLLYRQKLHTHTDCWSFRFL